MYRELWRSHGIAIADLRGPEDLIRLPLIHRQQLRDAGTRGRLDDRYRGRLRNFGTSGSTGEPLELLFDEVTLRRRQWRFLRALWACGFRPGMRVMLVSSRSSKSVKQVSRIAALMRWHYVDLYEGEQQMLKAFERVRPHVLYAPQNALLSLVAAARGTRAKHTPRVLVSTSERLTDAAERTLQEHFGVSVTDFYGMTEMGLVAWRRAGARSYDYAASDVHLEFLPTGDRDLLQVVATDLRGGSMPFYRYATGDLVRLEGDRLAGFGGKELDSLLMPDGTRIAPYLVDGALGRIEGLIRYRIVQNPDFSISASIEATTLQAAGHAQQALRALICDQVPVALVQEFEPGTPTHKLRPIVSLARQSA